MKILLWPNPTLKLRSLDVDLALEYDPGLAQAMLDTMKASGGVGLSAIQIGVSQRLFVLDAGAGPEVFINPHSLTTTGDRVPMTEGCLSTPGQYDVVWRHPEVAISHLNRDLVPVVTKAEGLRAQAIQHELEHLDGMIFVDHLKPASRGRILGAMIKYKKNGGK